MKHTVLFVGGGSIGHIAPSVAVWETLSATRQDVTPYFICSPRGEDHYFLLSLKLPHSVLHAPRLSVSLLWRFPLAYLRSERLLSDLKPSVVFSKGGYVSIPVCLAAWRRRIPIILHESDAVMGYANRLIAMMATTVCLGMESSSGTTKLNCHVTGNPVRASVTKGTKAEAKRITKFSGTRPVLLVLGGSQGSQAINDAVNRNKKELTALCDIIHVTGRDKGDIHREPHYWSAPFVTTDLPHFYALATIALSRSGAGSIAELSANAIPTLLVPLRKVGHDHQQKNALRAQEQGGYILVPQEQLMNELPHRVERLLADEQRLEAMRKKMQKTHHVDATGQIARIISVCLEQRHAHH